jgi:hypothetical protein
MMIFIDTSSPKDEIMNESQGGRKGLVLLVEIEEGVLKRLMKWFRRKTQKNKVK